MHRPTPHHLLTPGRLSLRAALALFLFGTALALAQLSDAKNYTYLYYQNGYPTQLSGTRAPPADANLAGRTNPDLVFQTGYYSLRFDADAVALTGWNTLAGSNYLTALGANVTTFTAATLNLWVYVGGVRYKVIASPINATGATYVRLIESGQYRQRVDHINLVFQHPTNGATLAQKGVLEITAWPDRVSFTLDCSDITGATRTTVQLIANGITYLKDVNQTVATLVVSPNSSPLLTSSTHALSHLVQAKNLANDAALPAAFDASTHSLVITLPGGPRRQYPADLDRLDQYRIEVRNPGAQAINLPLVFEEDQTPPATGAITGTGMILCADTNGYGYPLGHNVQISKNWHTDYADLHAGNWVRGITMVKLDPGQTKTYRLRVVHGFWGKLPAAHNVQLSLIGYGTTTRNTNWSWEQSALGSWGEALTYDLSGSTSSTHLNDIRPSFTTPMNGTSTAYNWTENVGGGNFLFYRDAAGTFQHPVRLKTAFARNGPNLAELHYRAESADGKIVATYRTQLGRTFDYHRAFHHFKYQFSGAVTNPSRLTFYQIAGDYYKTARYATYHYGNTAGLLDTVTDFGATGYNGSFTLPTHGWIAIADTHGNDGNTSAKAARGLIVRKLTRNGIPLTATVHRHRSGYGNAQTTFQLAAGSVTSSYAAGDVIEGTVELVFPARTAATYWGGDSAFAGRLASYSNSWSAVHDEARYNNLSVAVHAGTFRNSYPIVVGAATTGTVLADVTVASGGLGHVPVVIEDVPVGNYLQVQRYNGSAWIWLEDVNLTTNQNYYQGTLNAAGKMDYAFNIDRPDANLAASWRFRVLKVAP
jgi:hypothetical protein